MAAPETEPTAAESERILRKLIGEDVKLDEIFTKERIAASQQMLDDARGVFFDRAGEELKRLQDLAIKNKAALEQSEIAFDDMVVCAGNLQGHAEMFGFALIAVICDHIGVLCKADSPYSPAARISLASDLVRMLGIAIREKVTDETGAVGRELKASLKKY